MAIHRKKRASKIENHHKINDQIQASRVLLVLDDGNRPNVYTLQDAIIMADEQGLDLVEIGPNSDPPVVKMMNYGKFKFQQQKAQKRQQQKPIKQKEIKFRPDIEDRDRDVKINHGIKFLKAGHKLRVTIMFTGRQMAHADRGKELLQEVSAALVPKYGAIDSEPNLDGRNMSMVLVPTKEIDSSKEE